MFNAIVFLLFFLIALSVLFLIYKIDRMENKMYSNNSKSPCRDISEIWGKCEFYARIVIVEMVVMVLITGALLGRISTIFPDGLYAISAAVITIVLFWRTTTV